MYVLIKLVTYSAIEVETFFIQRPIAFVLPVKVRQEGREVSSDVSAL